MVLVRLVNRLVQIDQVMLPECPVFFPHETKSNVPHYQSFSRESSRTSMGLRGSESRFSYRSSVRGSRGSVRESMRTSMQESDRKASSKGLLDHFDDPTHPLYHHDHHKHGHHHHHGHHHRHGVIIPFLEELPAASTEMIKETYDSHRDVKRRIKELQEKNIRNDQIILLFMASRDHRGKIWHQDCSLAERAVSYLIKKVQAGGYLIKINVGNRAEWMDPSNVWKRDPMFKLQSLPTLMVCDTMKRLNGKKIFDMESIIALLQD